MRQKDRSSKNVDDIIMMMKDQKMLNIEKPRQIQHVYKLK